MGSVVACGCGCSARCVPLTVKEVQLVANRQCRKGVYCVRCRTHMHDCSAAFRGQQSN